MTDNATGGLLGRDITAFVPAPDEVAGLVQLDERDQEIWQRALPHLRVRDNDTHTLHSYGIARALVPLVPGARAEIVLPAVLLHDSGWSTVPEDRILEAIAPRPLYPELVRIHEIEGACIAREVLHEVGLPAADIDEIATIIDGHDSRPRALDPSDAAMKDADKLWRITPHGLATIRRWFGLDAAQTLRLVSARTHDHLFTQAGQTMARAFGAVASIGLSPQRLALDHEETP
jgi:hypothetical protein